MRADGRDTEGRILIRSHTLSVKRRHRRHITSHHMENTEAGLQRPLFLRNRLKTTSI